MVYISKEQLPLLQEIILRASGNLHIRSIKDPRSNSELIQVQEHSGNKGDKWQVTQIGEVLEDGEFKWFILGKPKKIIPSELPDSAFVEGELKK